jgi:Spy/CpxP family protein refolding chaperone
MRLWFKPAFAGGLFASMHWFGRRAGRGAGQHRRHGLHDRAAWRDRAVQQLARRLDLDDAQRTLLAALVERLQAQRDALRGPGDWRADLRSLVQDGTFDRWHAQDLLQARINALREHGPQVIAAMAELYDRLDARQQAQVRQWLDRWGGWHH